MLNNNQERTIKKFYIKGMHCASCEMIIEKKLSKENGVVSADVDLNKGSVEIETSGNNLFSESYLDFLFKDDDYVFSDKPFVKQMPVRAKTECEIVCEEESQEGGIDYTPYLLAALLLAGFYILQRTGFASLVSVNSQSSLPVFFLFGLLAGLSSCAALIGGIILSLSKQWLSIYDKNDSSLKKSEPHILFNTGRVLGYGVFGGLLGLVGNFFRVSPTFSAALVIAVSFLMILLGLQMLGVKVLARYQLRLPKSFSRKFSNEENFQGRFGPLVMGALTFFLPCGFTITVQALALASGNPLQGALIMGVFAFGTAPGLLAIGLSSVKLFGNPKVAKQFSIVAGVMVLAFASSNINAQMSVLGVSNIADVLAAATTIGVADKNRDTSLVPVVSGKQVIRMEASSRGYSPNRFKVRVGQPVRLEVTDVGTSGCTNAIISKLWDGQIPLTLGTTSVKEFTPSKAGVYKFSCWMGMVSGTIEVVDGTGTLGAANTKPIETGAKGCGCGGGGSGSCGSSK